MKKMLIIAATSLLVGTGSVQADERTAGGVFSLNGGVHRIGGTDGVLVGMTIGKKFTSRIAARLSMQSTWNVGPALLEGELVPVLGPYMMPDLAIYAVYPPTRQTSAKVRLFIDSLLETIGPEPYWDRGLASLLNAARSGA